MQMPVQMCFYLLVSYIVKRLNVTGSGDELAMYFMYRIHTFELPLFMQIKSLL